jgi:Ca2+/Na+ antiporter
MVGSSVNKFRSIIDDITFLVLLVSGLGLCIASLRYRRGDGRQPVIQGPGVVVAAMAGLFVSFAMDGVLEQLEVYQLFFTFTAWALCTIMFALYIKRYQPLAQTRTNRIRYVFSHWLVQF